MNASRPSFLITIDTEGDNLWSRPKEISTRNSRFLARFQCLCESYGFKPTYLTNYEMAQCPNFREFATDVLKQGTAEIGMHLHAWNSPPIAPLTTDDYSYQPFLIEYPERAVREKVVFLTELLEDTFGVKMRSHRAGRWSFNETYARILLENRYQVDCSVTPLVSWKAHTGDPNQKGGTDYSRYPDTPYFVDPEDISRAGYSELLEVPMTILSFEPEFVEQLQKYLGPRSLPARVLRRVWPPVLWLRPNGSNLSSMLRILKRAEKEMRPCVEFMLHSSEFMPGGSPIFASDESIERLYDDLERLFSAASKRFTGATLSEFRARCTGRAQRPGEGAVSISSS